MAQSDPIWTRLQAEAEALGDLMHLHRRDGHVDAAEAEREVTQYRRVFELVVVVAETRQVVQAFERGGLDGVRARRLLREHDQRTADAARFAPHAPEAA